MKSDSLKGKTLAVISTIMIYFLAIISIVMYQMTNYYIYHFLGMTSLLLGSTNLLFVLLKYVDFCRIVFAEPTVKKPKKKKSRRRKKNEAIEETTEEAAEEDIVEVKPKKKSKIDWFILVSILCVLSYILIYYNSVKNIVSFAATVQAGEAPALANGVLLLILFVILLVLDRLCKYSEDNSTFTSAIVENSRIFFQVLSAQALLGVVCVVIEWLQLVNIQKYIAYLYTGIFFYYVAFITISLLVIAIRKDFVNAPYINVPIPFYKAKGKRESFIDYLEKNTGISMRSLWSVKYIKQIAPIVILISGFLLWISTCVVQVESYQQAAVYRIGKLQEKFLEPGIHLVLPYPFDKVEIYDTGNIQKTTIGYRSEESGDNIWTAGHDGEEYKLLLGSGDELVSINLRLEYQISDLKKYLTTATAPVSVMEALAYELVMDDTIATDLDSLLSADRKEFAKVFQKELTTKMKEKDIGLEVVSVVLESIHPPVEIANVYQELISAEITYDRNILYAEGAAIERIATAQKTADTIVVNAQANNSTKVAEAKSSVAEFLASLEAYRSDPSAYKYQKYLAAVRKAYGNANLVILGEGVDESALFFGNFSGGSSGSSSSSGNSSNSGNSSSSGNSSNTTQ